MFILLYVDDLIILNKYLQVLQYYKNCLKENFQMTDLNEIKLFLGIRIIKTKDKITLDQSIYLQNILNKFSMSDCNPSKSPLPNKINYFALNSDVHYNARFCKNLIGCLMYAMTCTRPDLCAAINILSRYQSKNNVLWKCLKHLLKYIKGTINFINNLYKM